MNSKHLFFTIALIITLVISYDLYYWISFWPQENGTVQETNAAYFEHVPRFLRNTITSTIISILLLILSVLILLKTKTIAQLKKPCYILITIDCLLLLWMLFSLS